MTETTKPTNVVAALSRVMAELPGIGKDQTSPQGYQYRGIEQITKEAQGLFAKYGVVFAPEVESWEERELVVNGKPWSDQRLIVRYRVYGPGGLEDFIEVCVAGIGRDNSDKGANKAMSQAFKYALLQVLCIADAKDDSDADTAHEAEKPPRRAASKPAEDRAPALVAELLALADKSGETGIDEKIARNRGLHIDEPEKHIAWLTAAIDAARAKEGVEATTSDDGDDTIPF